MISNHRDNIGYWIDIVALQDRSSQYDIKLAHTPDISNILGAPHQAKIYPNSIIFGPIEAQFRRVVNTIPQLRQVLSRKPGECGLKIQCDNKIMMGLTIVDSNAWIS